VVDDGASTLLGPAARYLCTADARASKEGPRHAPGVGISWARGNAEPSGGATAAVGGGATIIAAARNGAPRGTTLYMLCRRSCPKLAIKNLHNFVLGAVARTDNNNRSCAVKRTPPRARRCPRARRASPSLPTRYVSFATYAQRSRSLQVCSARRALPTTFTVCTFDGFCTVCGSQP
jgi:hypothetical protein